MYGDVSLDAMWESRADVGNIQFSKLYVGKWASGGSMWNTYMLVSLDNGGTMEGYTEK